MKKALILLFLLIIPSIHDIIFVWRVRLRCDYSGDSRKDYAMPYYFRKIHDKSCIKAGALRDSFGLTNIKAPIVAIVGAGGKTTLIEALAMEYAAAGVKVLVTTTTHMKYPKGQTVLFADGETWKKGESKRDQFYENLRNGQEISEQLARLSESVIYVASHDRDFEYNQKIMSPTEDILRALMQSGYPVLVEADGSKGLLCKVPADHEPVIPKEANTVIGVLSNRAIGERISDCCHRPSLVGAFLGKNTEDRIELKDLEKIAFSDQGLKKSVTEQMHYYAVINEWNERL